MEEYMKCSVSPFSASMLFFIELNDVQLRSFAIDIKHQRAAAELAIKITLASFVLFVLKSPDPIPLWRLRADKYNLFLKRLPLVQSYYSLKEHYSNVVSRKSRHKAFSSSAL